MLKVTRWAEGRLVLLLPSPRGSTQGMGPARGLGVATCPPRQHRQLAEPLQSPLGEGKWGSVRKEGSRR